MLPDRLDPVREPVGEHWNLVEEIPANVLDTMIRRMGWHFLSVLRPYCRKAYGMTEANAERRALARSLSGIAREYNAAELIAVQAKRVLGIHVSKITMQPRHIQQLTSLEIASNWHRMIVPTR